MSLLSLEAESLRQRYMAGHEATRTSRSIIFLPYGSSTGNATTIINQRDYSLSLINRKMAVASASDSQRGICY